MSRDAAPSLDHVRRRQRQEFGGVSWGSAFFGWKIRPVTHQRE
jgi:hypothetical protein